MEYVARSVDANGNVVSTTKSITSYIKLSSVTKEWQNSKWYYAEGKIAINRVTVSGDVHLILKKGCTLKVEKGIHVLEGSSLTIYGQPNGDGTLIATGDSGQAGIGGFNGYPHNAPITITIHGGNIQATGGGGGAGIGCAGLLPSAITIYGGTITAQGGTNSAGIGGGDESTRPTITIYGGSITATGCQNGAGIGGGDNSLYYTVNIYGGNITASRYDYHNGYGIRDQITLSYRNAGDSIYATNYGGTVTVADGKTFIVDGTEINGTLEIIKEEVSTSPTEVLVFDTCPAIDGKTLTPPSYKVNVGTNGITASTAAAFPGETVTVSPAEGYNLTSGVCQVNCVRYFFYTTFGKRSINLT